MKNLTVLLMGMCALWLLLAACAANDPQTAVQYLEALNQRDIDTARALVCEARQDDVTMGLTTVDDPVVEPFTFSNISCGLQGGDVMCRYTISQETLANPETGEQQTREVIFAYEDGKICGFEEQVAQ